MAQPIATKKVQTKPKPLAHDVQNCILKMTRNAKKQDKSIEHIDFELSSIQRFGAKPLRYKTGQSIKIWRTSKRGKAKATKTFVAHSYCPFCGKKF